MGVGHSLRTEKIFVGKTSSGFPEDINREDEVTLTSVSWGCVKIGAASLFCNILKTIKESPDFHKLGLCHVKKFL